MVKPPVVGLRLSSYLTHRHRRNKNDIPPWRVQGANLVSSELEPVPSRGSRPHAGGSARGRSRLCSRPQLPPAIKSACRRGGKDFPGFLLPPHPACSHLKRRQVTWCCGIPWKTRCRRKSRAEKRRRPRQLRQRQETRRFGRRETSMRSPDLTAIRSSSTARGWAGEFVRRRCWLATRRPASRKSRCR